MDKKSRVIRKPDPSRRKDIRTATLNKIKSFLKQQKNPVFKSDIVRIARIDYNSLNVALTMIDHEIDDEGRISIKKKEGAN